MPQNWKTYKLEDISEIKSGKRLPKGHTLVAEKTDFPYIRLVDIKDNAINEDSLMYLLPETKSKIQKYIVNTNDVCLAIVGHTIGLVFYINEKYDDYNLTENAARLTSFLDDFNSKYIYYNLFSPQGYQKLLSRKVGSAQGKLPLYNIRSFELNLPPLPEQTAIANILSAIDDKIENNLAINKTLEEMAMALYKECFVDFGPFQDGDFVESELGMIPEGWEVTRLDEVLEIKYGKDHKKLEDGLIPVYGSGGIMRYVDTYLYNEDSILIPRKGTLSNLFYVTEPFWSVDTMFYSKIKNKVFGHYLFHFLKCLDLAGMDVGSAVPSLTTSLLKRLSVLIPPEEEILKFDKIASQYFTKRTQNKKQNQTLTTLRDTLLPRLISGEVRLDCFAPRSDSDCFVPRKYNKYETRLHLHNN